MTGEVSGQTPQDTLEKNILFFKDLELSISEWIPFGQNAIANINETLDSVKGYKESLLTGKVDEAPETSEFKMRPFFTRVILKEFDKYDWIKFTAHIEYPEKVVQVRHVGVHIDKSGFINHGLRLEQVWSKEVEFSLDASSAVVADVVEDTSIMLEALLTQFQQRTLNLVYGTSYFRPKFVIAKTTGIIPAMDSAKGYDDDEDMESELNQLVGVAYQFHDLPFDDQMILGTNGIILITNEPGRYGRLLSLYSGLRALQMFQSGFFSRLRSMWDAIKDLRASILGMETEEIFEKVEQELAELGADIVQVEEITSFMRNGLDIMREIWEINRGGLDEANRALAEAFHIERELAGTEGKIRDMETTSSGLVDEIQGLREMIGTLAERRMREMSKLMTDNVQQGSEAQQIMLANVRASRYSSAALRVLSAISAGALGMKISDIIIRAAAPEEFFGSWVHLSVGFVLWIILTYTFFALIKTGIERIKEQKLAERYNLNVRFPLDIRSATDRIKRFIDSKEVVLYNVERSTHRVAWHHRERIGENEVFYVLTLCFDPVNGHLHYLHANTENRQGTVRLTTDIVIRELTRGGLIDMKQAKEIDRNMGIQIEGGESA